MSGLFDDVIADDEVNADEDEVIGDDSFMTTESADSYEATETSRALSYFGGGFSFEEDEVDELWSSQNFLFRSAWQSSLV